MPTLGGLVAGGAATRAAASEIGLAVLAGMSGQVRLASGRGTGIGPRPLAGAGGRSGSGCLRTLHIFLDVLQKLFCSLYFVYC
jgi:hypothetical protein